jgi:NAD(P)-dependent dehydrogenase (short-subunit alcohol dehydrogenase family)
VKLPRKALLIGADGNLGPTWVAALLEKGISVVGVGLNVEMDPELTNVCGHFQNIELVSLDLTQKDDFNQLVKMIQTRDFSEVVYNAGIDSRPGEGASEISDYDLEHFRRIFEVNTFIASQVIGISAKHLSTIGGGTIVAIGSMYAEISPNPELYSHFNDGRGSVKSPAYGASKAALLSLVKQYSVNYAKNNVRINMLSPGGVIGKQDQTFIEKFQAKTPVARLIDPSELKSTLIWMLDPSNTQLIGKNISLDGGYSNW